MKKYLSFMLIALIAVTSFVSCKAEPEHVHDWKPVAGKEATCTEAGYKAYEECECGEKKGYEVIPALGHDYTGTCEQGHAICKGCGNAEPGQTVTVDKSTAWKTVEGKSSLACGCDVSVAVGSVGPAGGYIFYDCDADNAAEENDGLVSSECGWRYLESAPTLVQTGYVIGTDADNLGKAIIGYYMKGNTLGDNNKPLNAASVGTATAVGTKMGIGFGKSNTAALVAEEVVNSTMTGKSESSSRCSTSTASKSAAYVCNNLTYTVNDITFDDWFLPSTLEMEAFFKNIVLGLNKTDIIPARGEAEAFYATSSESVDDEKDPSEYFTPFKVYKTSASKDYTVEAEATKANKAGYETLPIRQF